MKKYPFLALVFTAALIFCFTGCQKHISLKELKPDPSAQSYDYKTTAFSRMRQNGDNSDSNSVTNEGAALGRLLFYDPSLSVNNAISCASCHKQQYAFADNLSLSIGYQGQKTLRNTPPIINAANKSVFFWDGRESSLETQTLMPVKNHIEMGLEQTDVLIEKLSSTSYYPQYFQKAFGTSEINSARISKALAQFIRSIASVQSPMDGSQYTADALLGRSLFFSKLRCGSCHRGFNLGGAPTFSPYNPSTIQGMTDQALNTSNIGLEMSYADQGEQALTGKSTQNGYFIIPSLRNIALTAPYMHDGSLKTLDDVIDHYSRGIQPHPDLDPILLQQNFDQGFVTVASGQPLQMNISADERRQLKAYLNSLTDETIATDPKFSNPFK